MENRVLTEITGISGMNFHREFIQNIDEEEYRIISEKLSTITQADKAKVRELYFINENEKDTNETIMGQVKEVFWISNFYKPEICGIYLNKRCGTGEHFFEERVPLSQLQYIKLMSGDDIWMKNHDIRLITEFYVKKQLFGWKPNIVVESQREQYFSDKQDINIHIDREIVVENPNLEVEKAEIRKMFDTQPIIMNIKVKENAVREVCMQFYYNFKNIISNKEIFTALDMNNELLALA